MAIISSIEISIYTVLKNQKLSAGGVQLDISVDNIKEKETLRICK